MADYLFRIIEKKLLDKNYQVTQEEIAQATEFINERMIIAELSMEVLRSEQKLINMFIQERRKIDGFSKSNDSNS